MRLFISLLIFLVVFGCSKQQVPTHFTTDTTEVDGDSGSDKAIEALIAPYTEGLEAEMNTVISSFAHDMYKARPESELGNFMCDAVFDMYNAELVEGVAAADVCFMNYGGIRMQHIPAGDITVGTMFSLMPFENEVVRMELSGDVLRAFLDKTAASGGWPVSKQTQMVVKNKQLISMSVQGVAVNENSVLTVLVSDYVANGGDGMDMLKEVPREKTGKFVRDYMIEYCKQQQSLGKPISVAIEGRVVVNE